MTPASWDSWEPAGLFRIVFGAFYHYYMAS